MFLERISQHLRFKYGSLLPDAYGQTCYNSQDRISNIFNDPQKYVTKLFYIYTTVWRIKAELANIVHLTVIRKVKSDSL